MMMMTDKKLKTCLTALVLVFMLLIFSSYHHIKIKKSNNSYIIIIDAGSTGTRLYLYKDDSKSNISLTLIPSSASPSKIPIRPGIRSYDRIETLPGIHQIYLNSTVPVKSIKNALDPLFQWAKDVVPEENYKSTSVYFYGTAGLREMKITEQSKLITYIDTYLQNSQFQYKYENLKIMSGDDEGIYGWIAMNYAKNLLSSQKEKKYKLPRGHPIKLEEETYGVLDLGGSSLEITLEKKEDIKTEFIHDINIFDRNYMLESRTFEDKGLNRAFSKSLHILLNNNSNINVKEIFHPCIHDGYFNFNEEINLNVHGKVNWTQCLKLAHQVLDIDENCSEPCISDFSDALSLRQKYYGLNGFYVLWSFFNLESSDSVSILELEGQYFCETNWSTIYENKKDIVHLDKYCFRSAYVSILIKKYLGLKSWQLQISLDQLSWTLGAAILQKSNLYIENQKLKFIYNRNNRKFWIIVVKTIFGILGILLCITLSFKSMKSERKIVEDLEMGKKPMKHDHVKKIGVRRFEKETIFKQRVPSVRNLKNYHL